MKKQDLRVHVKVKEAPAAATHDLFEIGMFAKSKAASLNEDSHPEDSHPEDSHPKKLENDSLSANVSEIQYHLITQAQEIEKVVDPSDLPEVLGGFIEGQHLHLWTLKSPSCAPAGIKAVASRVRTLILSSSISEAFIKTPEKLDFNGVIVYTSVHPKPWENEDLKHLALQKHTCVMIDPEKQGKALFAFASILDSTHYPVVGFTTSVEKKTFKSLFDDQSSKDLLLQNYFSFYLNCDDHPCFLWDLFAGHKQIQTIYAYYILKEEIGEVICDWLEFGQNYDEKALSFLKGLLSDHLLIFQKKQIMNSFDIHFEPVKDQLASDKLQGLYQGFHLDFNEQYRIAAVTIYISGHAS